MASQQTPNYRLSRWAGTDRILVEEFNDNWDKIDTALKSNAEAVAAETAAREAADTELANNTTWTELKSVTLPNDNAIFSLDLSDVNWGQYEQVRSKIELQGTGTFFLRLNSTSCKIVSGSNSFGPQFLTFWPRHTPETAIAAVFQGYGNPTHLGSTNIRFCDLANLHLVTYGNSEEIINAGSRLTLYGHL